MKRIGISEKPLELSGLPWWNHSGDKLLRLPVEMEERVSADIWELAKQPSGARIRFCSDTTKLGITLNYNTYENMENMCTIGHMGLDVYVDGRFWSCVYPQRVGKMEGWFFQNASKQMRQITIYLPLYQEVKIENIILDEEAEINSPESFCMKQPVVFYGTSITQGGCASRAGLSYQAMVGRDLNIDFINLGFSGNGKGEATIARELAGIDAACYVLDYGQNNESIRGFEKVYYPFISEIRKAKPNTPILLTTPIFYTQENWDAEYLEMQNSKREIIRNVYRKCIDAGDRNIYLVEWNKIISLEDGDGQVDGYHPNDLGFHRMSTGLKTILMQILKLS